MIEHEISENGDLTFTWKKGTDEEEKLQFSERNFAYWTKYMRNREEIMLNNIRPLAVINSDFTIRLNKSAIETYKINDFPYTILSYDNEKNLINIELTNKHEKQTKCICNDTNRSYIYAKLFLKANGIDITLNQGIFQELHCKDGILSFQPLKAQYVQKLH